MNREWNEPDNRSRLIRCAIYLRRSLSDLTTTRRKAAGRQVIFHAGFYETDFAARRRRHRCKSLPEKKSRRETMTGVFVA